MSMRKSVSSSKGFARHLSPAGMQEAIGISPVIMRRLPERNYPTRITSALETMHSRNESAKRG
jgi:hypothetical protein